VAAFQAKSENGEIGKSSPNERGGVRFAPTGRNMTAQGNALGTTAKQTAKP